MSVCDHSQAGKIVVSKVGAVVVAAGKSSRMGGVDKVLAPLAGRPVVAHCLDALNACPDVTEIVLVMSEHNLAQGRRLVDESCWHKVVSVCVGGARRQDSVRHGIERLGDTALTLVHDGARPFIDGALLTRAIAEGDRTGAAVAAVPVKDTIKAVGRDGVVVETLDRERLWAVQTPQVFETALLLEAHRVVTEPATDDASMVERIGRPVSVFMGSHGNMKVTTPEDIVVAEAMVRVGSEHGASLPR